MRERTFRSLIEAPRWLLLLTLFYAPWAYGCTVPWAIDLLEILLGLTLGSWLLGCAVRGMRPQVNQVSVVCVGVLLAVGWGMTANALFVHDAAQFRFSPVAAAVAFAPGTIDRATSLAAMWRLSMLLGVILFVSDFSRLPEWRRRLWWTIGLAGTSIVFLGLIQHASGIPLMFPGRNSVRDPFFATFFYHGNAGSFINLVFPAIAGLLLVSVGKPNDDLGRALWVSALLMCLAGAALSYSRAAMVLTGLLCVPLASWAIYRLRRSLTGWQLCLYGGIVLLAVIGVTAMIGWEPMLEKWRKLGGQLNSTNPRLLATQVCLQMLKDTGAFGFGPGTFGIAFPHYSNFLGDSMTGVWRYAHQDYLQTLIEWGWVGAAVWAVLFGGGMAGVLLNWRRHDLTYEDRTLIFASALALAATALHSLVDFPLQIASLQLYVAVYLGIGWGCRHWTASPPDTTVKSSSR